METWIGSERIYEGEIFSLRVGKVRLDDDSTAPREVIEHSGGVAVVPVLDDSVLLIRQFRIAVGREILELPAGRLEGAEAPEHRARRELEEEIGYWADELTPVASYYSSAGFTNERMHIFVASQLQATKRQPEEDERIAIVKMPLAEVRRALAAREFEDAKTIIGLREWLAHLDAQPEKEDRG